MVRGGKGQAEGQAEAQAIGEVWRAPPTWQGGDDSGGRWEEPATPVQDTERGSPC